MKVITLLSIFVVFYVINGIIACSSKETYLADSPDSAATLMVNACKGILGQPNSIGQGVVLEEDDQDKKEGSEKIALSADDEAFDDDDDTSQAARDDEHFSIEDN